MSWLRRGIWLRIRLQFTNNDELDFESSPMRFTFKQQTKSVNDKSTCSVSFESETFLRERDKIL